MIYDYLVNLDFMPESLRVFFFLFFLRYVDAGGPNDLDAGGAGENCHCWKKWFPYRINGTMVYLATPPKFNMEPEDHGFQKDFPFPGTYFQVPC